MIAAGRFPRSAGISFLGRFGGSPLQPRRRRAPRGAGPAAPGDGVTAARHSSRSAPSQSARRARPGWLGGGDTAGSWRPTRRPPQPVWHHDAGFVRQPGVRRRPGGHGTLGDPCSGSACAIQVSTVDRRLRRRRAGPAGAGRDGDVDGRASRGNAARSLLGRSAPVHASASRWPGRTTRRGSPCAGPSTAEDDPHGTFCVWTGTRAARAVLRVGMKVPQALELTAQLRSALATDPEAAQVTTSS